MKRLMIAVGGLLLSVAVCFAAEKKVLFIGNSYTFVNNLPRAFEALANVGGYKVKVDSYTKGAASLHEFLTSPEHAACRDRVAHGGYDYVILQDQSQTPYFMPERTLDAGEKWCALAKKAGAKPVLFLTWAHAQKGKNGQWQALAGMQEGTSTTYCKLAEKTGAKVAPVGEAWQTWYKKYPSVALHGNDGSHPNALGTYLAACVLYGTISDRKPTKLPSRLQGLTIPAGKVRDLQKIAEIAVRDFSAEKYLAARAKADAKLPSIESLKPLLQPGATMRPLLDKLGTPASREGETVHYRVQGGGVLALTPGAGDKVKQAIYIDAKGAPFAILLQP